MHRRCLRMAYPPSSRRSRCGRSHMPTVGVRAWNGLSRTASHGCSERLHLALEVLVLRWDLGVDLLVWLREVALEAGERGRLGCRRHVGRSRVGHERRKAGRVNLDGEVLRGSSAVVWSLTLTLVLVSSLHQRCRGESSRAGAGPRILNLLRVLLWLLLHLSGVDQ